MNDQTKADKAGFWKEAQKPIKGDKPRLMEGMKTNAATGRIINGISKEVVEIHQHRCHHK